MNDPEIRALLAPALAHYQSVVGELVIGNTAGDMTRADLVGLHDDSLHGYEIKSDGDTLKRVPLQLRCYGKVFSRVTFVVTAKHLTKVTPMLPEWVGLLVVNDNELVEVRPATAHREQSKYWLSGLLWGEELRELCKRHGIPAKARWRVWESQEALEACDTVTMAVLEAFVARCLLARMASKLRRRAIAKAIRSRQ